VNVSNDLSLMAVLDYCLWERSTMSATTRSADTAADHNEDLTKLDDDKKVCFITL
jgi:hypothetical protein